jgi:hypothetical protein
MYTKSFPHQRPGMADSIGVPPRLWGGGGDKVFQASYHSLIRGLRPGFFCVHSESADSESLVSRVGRGEVREAPGQERSWTLSGCSWCWPSGAEARTATRPTRSGTAQKTSHTTPTITRHSVCGRTSRKGVKRIKNTRGH